jgi:hypothetical protein
MGDRMGGNLRSGRERRFADFAGLASAADGQHGIFGQDGFNCETRHGGFVGVNVAFAGQAMADAPRYQNARSPCYSNRVCQPQ